MYLHFLPSYIFLPPLSSSVPGNSAGDVQLFRNYLSELYQSPRMFRHPTTGGVVISTFSGENSIFGQSSMEDGWAYLKHELNKIAPVRLPCSLLSFQTHLILSRSTSFHHSLSTQRVIPVSQLWMVASMFVFRWLFVFLID
jgi:hypothetical protein